MKKFSYVILMCLFISLTACNGTKSSSGGSLSQTVERHEQQIQSLRSQVGQVEQVLPGQAEMWSQMQSMRGELNQIHGSLSDAGISAGTGASSATQESIRRLQVAVRQIASQLAINIDQLEVGAQPAGGSSVAPVYGGVAAPVAQPVNSAPTSSSAAENLYNSGIKLFDQFKYQDAIAAFKAFSANYPTHQLAGNAVFWEGEAHFQLQDYGRAALAYQEVLDKHKGSQKYQSAMLKQGISLYNAGKKDAGKQRLEELTQKYPSSPETSRAKQFLASNK